MTAMDVSTNTPISQRAKIAKYAVQCGNTAAISLTSRPFAVIVQALSAHPSPTRPGFSVLRNANHAGLDTDNYNFTVDCTYVEKMYFHEQRAKWRAVCATALDGAKTDPV